MRILKEETLRLFIYVSTVERKKKTTTNDDEEVMIVMKNESTQRKLKSTHLNLVMCPSPETFK